MSRLYEKNRDLSRAIERIELTVQPEEEGRLDQFLAAKLKWRSRTGARKLVEDGLVTVNGAVRKSSTRLREGDGRDGHQRKGEDCAPTCGTVSDGRCS